MKKCVRCDLPKSVSGRFKEYCRDMGISYEPSENGDDIHFECWMTDDEISSANKFINKNC